MGSMEYEEVVRRLEAMIEKAAREGRDKKRFALICALDDVRLVHRYSEYGNCNTCQKNQRCKMAPGYGDRVRINCPHFEGARLVSEWRGDRNA